jgi:predicted unusual protein kinase regulating ubiquinone biosynthesis (AarF/ABC1/UbiB family)
MLRARYRRITFFFARMLLGLALWEIILPRLGLRPLVERTRNQRLKKTAARLRELALHMGGVMIKIGQFLSARVDVLPIAFTEELENLQDEVPAERYPAIRQVVEAEFKAPILDVFTAFDEQPLAAASIGQAHFAWLKKPNRAPDDPDALVQVVVKVQRPNIDLIVATDLKALDRVGKWLSLYEPIRRRVDIPLLLADFSRTLHEEMDYLHEGRNAEAFAANFTDQPRVVVPRVAWAYTTPRVITLENVNAIKITDYEAITAAGVSRKEVASLLFRTYLQQIFSDHFFHADPHPGNLFVVPGVENGAAGREWQLVYVDFGMMGRITPVQRAGLREMAIAITTQDAPRAIKAYQMLGFLLPDADTRLLEQAGTQVFQRFWGKSTTELRDISFNEVVEFTHQYKALLYSLPFQIPEDLILLGRAVSILSGMCTGLDPEFNVWHSLLPYAQELMAEDSQTRNWESWRAELVELQRRLIRLPGRLNNLLLQLEHGELATRNPELDRRVDRLEAALRRLIAAVVFGAALTGGIQLILAKYTLAGALLAGIALLGLVWALLARDG